MTDLISFATGAGYTWLLITLREMHRWHSIAKTSRNLYDMVMFMQESNPILEDIPWETPSHDDNR